MFAPWLAIKQSGNHAGHDQGKTNGFTGGHFDGRLMYLYISSSKRSPLKVRIPRRKSALGMTTNVPSSQVWFRSQ
jgi:hypothetical protein